MQQSLSSYYKSGQSQSQGSRRSRRMPATCEDDEKCENRIISISGTNWYAAEVATDRHHSFIHGSCTKGLANLCDSNGWRKSNVIM